MDSKLVLDYFTQQEQRLEERLGFLHKRLKYAIDQIADLYAENVANVRFVREPELRFASDRPLLVFEIDSQHYKLHGKAIRQSHIQSNDFPFHLASRIVAAKNLIHYRRGVATIKTEPRFDEISALLKTVHTDLSAYRKAYELMNKYRKTRYFVQNELTDYEAT